IVIECDSNGPRMNAEPADFRRSNKKGPRKSAGSAFIRGPFFNPLTNVSRHQHSYPVFGNHNLYYLRDGGWVVLEMPHNVIPTNAPMLTIATINMVRRLLRFPVEGFIAPYLARTCLMSLYSIVTFCPRSTSSISKLSDSILLIVP